MIQALLKDRLGVGVESWGGRGDHGIDAWCDGPLHFPAKDVLTEGPFLFQVKFVEEANAAGARPMPRLIAAVRAEMKMASQRRAKGAGKRCAHYVLITNVLLSPQDRESGVSVVSASLPESRIHPLGGGDICDQLDLTPALRRSFPQLLSLRDLDALLAGLVDRKIVQKSSAAIAEAKDVVDVFVPTEAYVRAWEVLRKSHFVVLEGPPEMGKTAIAWMLALAQIASGWEAITCDGPDDFFGAYRADVGQIFIADDAFGRTEYDPTRGASWEPQLHRVYGRLGNTHWLVWTSRKHILERARNRMDLQGPAAQFPRPAEVLVDASQLTIREKALILYRHAKHSVSDPGTKDFIKQNAVMIVSDDAFTPERIRRFVVEALPRLRSETTLGDSERGGLIARVREGIRNPTERMRKSFQALSSDHKWMLVSLLEGEPFCSVDALVARFTQQCPRSSVEAQGVLDELTEAFIRIKGGGRYAGWIHPSYRDLVVEQLRDGGSLKTEFLMGMSLHGIKLALSDTGGEGGTLRFPLMRTDNDWILLYQRCIELAQEGATDEVASLLTILNSAIDQASVSEQQGLVATIKSTCAIARERWDSLGAALEASHILAYGQASIRASPLLPMPSLTAGWEAARTRLERELADEGSDFLFDFSALDDLLDLHATIERFEPRVIRQVDFPASYAELWSTLLDRVEYELRADRSYGDVDGYDSEADATFSLAASLERLGQLVNIQERITPLATRLALHANRCRERHEELRDHEGEDGSDSVEYPRSSDYRSEDIAAVFVDL
jgi:hypothetical protein